MSRLTSTIFYFSNCQYVLFPYFRLIFFFFFVAVILLLGYPIFFTGQIWILVVENNGVAKVNILLDMK